MENLKQRTDRSRTAWDECAATYEEQIVCGHPDIHAFECFEEDLLDRVLRYLVSIQERPVKLIDVGCGSGRLHLRYGVKTRSDRDLAPTHPAHTLRARHPELANDPELRAGLAEVSGVDFSARMIELAERKLEEAGLHEGGELELTLRQGSAFELEPEPTDVLPVAICLVNSIGVMQGTEGARRLFESMRHAVEPAGGIAMISCYQREYLPTYGLNQYESTLDVSGQPRWLAPGDLAVSGHRLVARRYKRAHDPDPTLVVDAFDEAGRLVEAGVRLEREPERTTQALETGEIRTYTDYESHWYSFEQVETWVRELWPAGSHHLATRELDAVRAEPAQLAILDGAGNLDDLLERWGLRA